MMPIIGASLQLVPFSVVLDLQRFAQRAQIDCRAALAMTASTMPSRERFRQAENRDKVYFDYVLARKRLNLFEKRLSFLNPCPSLKVASYLAMTTKQSEFQEIAASGIPPRNDGLSMLSVRYLDVVKYF